MSENPTAPQKKKLLTPTLIRDVDKWVGVPLCFLLTCLRSLFKLLRGGRERVRGPLEKILFIKMTELGATLIAHPAITRAIELVGRDNVYFWVFEENRAILELLDVIPRENILTVRTDKPLQFVGDVVRSILTLRLKRIDATIDLEFFARASAIFAYLCGARRRVGLHPFTNEGPYRGDLMTHRVAYNAYVHTSVMSQLLVESLVADPDDLPLLKSVPPPRQGSVPQYQPSQADLDQVRALLGEQGVGEGAAIVLLNPNASDLLPLRKWPTERFESLARRILDAHPEVTVVFTGAPAEAAQAEGLVRALGSSRAVSMAGRTSMRQLLTLYGLSRVLVTNDSGPAHFSAMSAVHTITLFGPETPLLYAPLGGRGSVVWAGLACSPCVNVFNHRFSPCRNNVCMQAITVEDVYVKVAEALSASAVAR
ncbi:MAG: glycosyltransferase family 9 protein [Proteobacteria bacterium]|nr:glycosyltransferase family 9 protein [Pseudomonadota bacterium]